MQQQSKFHKFPQLYSKTELLHHSVRSNTNSRYLQRANKFVNWLQDSNKLDPSIPKFDDFIKFSDIKTIDSIISDFLVCKFNQRGNSGGTLQGDISAIMFLMQTHGSIIQGELLPQCSRVIAGANSIVRTYKNPHLGEGTRALLNPMLEKQLELCKDPLQRLRILVPSRFGLRAEHVCSDLIRKDGIPRFFFEMQPY